MTINHRQSGIGVRAMAYMVAFAVVFGSTTAVAMPGDLEVELVVDGLQFPVKMASMGDGDFLVTEKMGALRLIRDGQLHPDPVAEFDVKVQNEAGLLDVVLAPDFDESGDLFLSYTPQEDLEAIYVSRLRLEGDSVEVLDDPLIELPSEPGADRHFAGTMAFDSEGYLFVSIGDLRERELSQQLENLPGTILRYRPDGTVPDDNPFGAQSPIYAYGLRNPFGISFDDDDNLFAVENSDDVNDELNVIEEGKNYGWPLVEGRCDNFPEHEVCEDRDQYEDPIFEFRTVNGPTAVKRYQGEMIGAFDNDILVTGWHTSAIHHLAWPGPGLRAEQKGILMRAPTTGAGFTDLAIDDDGAILVQESGANTGAIYRIARADDLWDAEQVVSDDDDDGCSTTQTGVPAGFLAVAVAGLCLVARRPWKAFVATASPGHSGSSNRRG